jgi:hypothetical protein
MTPGDFVRQCPTPGSWIEVTPSGAAVFSAAHDLYETFLNDPRPPDLDCLGPEVGGKLLCLLDACHDLIER